MCQQSNSYNNYLLNCQEGILTQVTLGSAKFSDCRNLGICRMDMMPKISNSGCENCLPGYLRLDLPTGRLLLHFVASSVDQKIYQRFFQKQTFRMDEDFLLPANIVKLLKLPQRTVIIEQGAYPVLNDDRFLTLSLRISELNGHLNLSPEYKRA